MSDGGPFAPVLEDTEFESGPRLDCVRRGISVRDWLAGQVVAGALNTVAAESDLLAIARAAYRLADAMILAREI